MDLETDRIRDLFDNWASSYDATVNSGGWGFEAYRDALEWVCMHVKRGKYHKVIDLGCGTGTLAGKLGVPSHNYVGIDISTAMLGIAARKYPNSEFIEADFRNISAWQRHLLTGDSCAIVSTYALHHINDQEKVNLFSAVMELRNYQNTVLLVADYAFLNSIERQDILQQQIALGHDEIVSEIKTEYFADLSTISRAMSSVGIHLTTKKNGPWDWLITGRSQCM